MTYKRFITDHIAKTSQSRQSQFVQDYTTFFDIAWDAEEKLIKGKPLTERDRYGIVAYFRFAEHCAQNHNWFKFEQGYETLEAVGGDEINGCWLNED